MLSNNMIYLRTNYFPGNIYLRKVNFITFKIIAATFKIQISLKNGQIYGNFLIFFLLITLFMTLF